MPPLTKTANKRFKRNDGNTLVVRIEPDFEPVTLAIKNRVLEYLLYKEDFGMFDLFFTTVFPEPPKPEPAYLGRILFDDEDNWIFDGEFLSVPEQEELAEFICNSHSDEPND